MTPAQEPYRRLCTTLAVLSCFASPPLAARDEPAPELFQERIGVEVVSIDVVVTDKKGRLVEGLTRDDFTLRIDGTEVPIANFYAATAAGQPPQTAAAPAAAAPTADPAAPTLSAEPLDLVVYLDNFSLAPRFGSDLVDRRAQNRRTSRANSRILRSRIGRR